HTSFSRDWSSDVCSSDLGRTTLRTFTTAIAALALGATSLLTPALAQDKGTVGVAMPTKSSARWIDDGNNMVKVLKEKGYNVDLRSEERRVGKESRDRGAP